MKVKKIIAANMQQALREVTEQLGADAAILSTRKVAEGMEVVAALNYQGNLSQAEITRQLNLQSQQEMQQKQLAQKTSPKPNAELEAWLNKVKQAKPELQKSEPSAKSSKAQSMRQSPVATQKLSAQPKDSKPVGLTQNTDQYKKLLVEMNDEMQELKKHMLKQQAYPVAEVDAWSHQAPLSWQQTQLVTRCRDMGIEREWAESLVASIDDENELEKAWKETLQNIEKELPIQYSKLLLEGGCYAFVGPTGAGKTTTIGKLAAQFAMRHGADSIALITLDQYRVAAHEQLKAFARIMGVELIIANNAKDLQKALKQQADKKLVLIDSAGLSPQNPHFSQQLSMLNSVKESLNTLLVLPLTNQARCLQENYERYKKLRLNGCVFTKLDECFSLGAALSVSALAELPITFVTDGPHIPDDVHQPEANKLVQLAEQMAKMSRTRWQAARTKQRGRDSVSA